jgi:hypothetical protein
MTRRDWLLLFVALDSEAAGLDPLRIQKGLFLLAQEGGLARNERYWFVPYNFGPMSPRLYRDVEALVRQRLLEHCVVEGRRWRPVRATRAGQERARQLVDDATPRELAAIERLRGIRRFVCGVNVTRLLSVIYERYPAFAEHSVFRRR